LVGHEREEYGRRAVELVDRLSPRERYYIEGYYYSLRTETMAKAIESYQRAIALYSDHVSAKHNLAVLYGNLERYDEAIQLYEDLRRRGAAFAFTYTNLMRAYTNMGQFDQARQVMDDYLREGSPAPAVLSLYGYRRLAEVRRRSRCRRQG
jgi:pentatricopeptide repeat protein